VVAACSAAVDLPVTGVPSWCLRILPAGSEDPYDVLMYAYSKLGNDTAAEVARRSWAAARALRHQLLEAARAGRSQVVVAGLQAAALTQTAAVRFDQFDRQ